MHRLANLLCVTLLIAVLFSASARAQTASETSDPAPDQSSLESAASRITDLMQKYHVPGGQLAVAKNGKLILSRQFGFADPDQLQPVTNSTLFRIASVSKVITATAIWQLIERGKLSGQDTAFTILSDLQPVSGSARDPRLDRITILQLLEHASGFGNKHGDPQFALERAAADQFRQHRPATPASIIRMRISEPLDFEPGTKSVYANFNFNVLGRVIEHVSGHKYSEYVQKNILAPAGVTDMQLGHTRYADRLPNEVWYCGRGQGDLWSVLDNESYKVGAPYGGIFAIECLDSHGGWVATAEDLVRIASALDGKPIGDDTRPLLQHNTRELMLAPTKYVGDKQGSLRGEGVFVRPATNTWLHTGALSGTSSALYSMNSTVQAAALFNYLPPAAERPYFTELDSIMTSILTCAEGDD